MAKQKGRHLEAAGEANRDKHINFLAEENGDVDPADENYNEDDDNETIGEDNGFFTDDDNKLQNKEEFEEDESVTGKTGATISTTGNKTSINTNNENLITPVKNGDTDPYINEDDQAH